MSKWYEVTDLKVYSTVVPTNSYTIACRKCGERFRTWNLYEATRRTPTCPACGYAGEEEGEWASRSRC